MSACTDEALDVCPPHRCENKTSRVVPIEEDRDANSTYPNG